MSELIFPTEGYANGNVWVAPNGQRYEKFQHGWRKSLSGAVLDAPVNGKQHARKDANWVEIEVAPTNLSGTRYDSTVVIESSTGENVEIPSATSEFAGVMSNVDKAKLDSIMAASTTVAGLVQLNNTLTSASTSEALTAAQGKLLKEAIDNINTLLNSDDTTLDELQEIVNYIKQNRQTLDALGISNVAGLEAALASKQNSLGTGTTSQYLRGDGTWQRPPNTTYSEISTAEIDAGTSAIQRTITGRRMKHALDKKANTSHTHNASDLNAGTVAVARLPTVTTSANGIMTSADKTKLDGIATGAQVNVATNLGTTVSGDTRTITSSTGGNVNIPVATTSAAGVMSRAMVTKLNGIAAGAQVNVATNLSIGTRTATVISVNSSTGTDVTLPAATTSLAGVMTSADKTKLDSYGTNATGARTVSTGNPSGGVDGNIWLKY